MTPRSLTPLFAPLFLLAPLAVAQDSIPLPEVRACAEFEPCLGTVVAFPTALPGTLAKDLTEKDKLYIQVPDAAAQALATTAMTIAGANLANVEFVLTPIDSFYTRDAGSPQAFRFGQHFLVDHQFYDYSVGDADSTSLFVFPPGAFVNDDRAPMALAGYVGMRVEETPLHLVGGNVDFDGLGTLWASRILEDENAYWGITPANFASLLYLDLGVSQLNLVTNFEPMDIQHIDCALKVLDEETLLVTRVPTDHPSYAYREQIAAQAEATLSPYGRPYDVIRLDAPVFKPGGWAGGSVANYANTLIVNDRVYVPLFGMPIPDTIALNTIEAAMPGYEVIGYEFVSGPHPWYSWESFDALHCRTHQVFDPEMLVIKHPRVRDARPGVDTQVMALVRAYTGSPLLPGATHVAWRVKGQTAWSTAALVPGKLPHELLATIPGQPSGTTVEYWLRAESQDGKVETRPPSRAPAEPTGFYEFTVP